MRRLLTGVLLGTLAVTGCASMPGSGRVHDVARGDGQDAAQQDQQVRVFGVPPQPGESPTGLVAGFLEAVTSDEPDYATARRYLTPEAAQRWRPDVGITVLDAFPQRTEAAPDTTEDTVAQVDVSGTRIASVDAQSAYHPEAGPDNAEHASFGLKRGSDGQWRIDNLPDGLLMSKADFHRIYRGVSMYWFAATADEPTLVPDPIYLRSRVGLTTALVQHLLGGPTAWLSPAVVSAFPPGTTLVDRAVSVDDSGVARVQLSDQARQVDADHCQRMGAQLLSTLAQASNVESVQLSTKHGGALCVVTKSEVARYDTDESKTTPTAYFLTPDKRVTTLPPGSATPVAMPGPFGDGTYHFDEIAVSRDGKLIAGIDSTGQRLLVGRVDGQGQVTEWAHASGSMGLLSPTWDGRGGLWVLDQTDNGTHVLVTSGTWSTQVNVEGVDPTKITGLRMSPDGTRAAIVVNATTVLVGRVDRTLPGGTPVITIADPQVIVPSLVEVKSVSWNGESRLAVLGKQDQGSLQPLIVDIDGGNLVAVAPVSGMEHLAAGDSTDQPLLADSSEPQVYRQAQGNSWTIVREGTDPVYPG